MFDGFLFAAFYGFFMAFAVGPVFFTLIETSIIKGFKAGLAFDSGAIFADLIFILIAYFSTSKLLDRVKDDPALLIFGGGILVAYGIISYIQTNKSLYKIVREHHAIQVKSNLRNLFLKGFFLNFVNFGVLAGWVGMIIIANAHKSTPRGVWFFISIVLFVFITTDILKIVLAKKLKNKMTPRFTVKTKKWVSLLIIGFGVLMLVQGIFPDRINAELEKIPDQEITIKESNSGLKETH
ncbi:LysE family translocator [Patiriisocius sp. Uisw_017]|jgi:threonine/homoserine/homoserine lactone efflux protein|uniref:LysE family translocator n=1 Tax=Patiriisocius sp. Uisw_017 TaxID=3230968 RepID=UPI0039E72D34